MKKVLALVLAVAMMATVAFAAAPAPELTAGGTYVPGDDIEIGMSDLADDVTEVKAANESLNTKNYSIKKVSYDTGKAFVASVTLESDEDEDCLTIALKEDFGMDKVKDLKMTVELRGKGRDTDDAEYKIDTTVGYAVNTVHITDNEVLASDIKEDAINKVGTKGNTPYGTLDIRDIEDMADVTVRLYEKDKFFWNTNVDADKKVLIANADSEAEISFLNFEGKPSFNSTATVYFYEVDEDGFVYELTGEGKIKKSAAKWSEDDGCWVLKTRTLGSYVFSDKALASAASADDTTTNPDTGANDVVGIATALAVVSLVAAGAISLKK